jgi:catechol 2,3-dioxygenase
MSAGGYHHHLGTNTWAARAPRAGANDARLLEWTLVLPKQTDVDAAAASLESAGFEVVREGGEVVTRDPWGTGARMECGDV